MKSLTAVLGLLLLFLPGMALATQTENLGIRVLPAPGKVMIDGKCDDWDLSGGIFICDDVETQRNTNAVWFHAMYDADNLYLLARWKDSTPLNNPGSVLGDAGWNGDCLQFRMIIAPGTPQERVSHWTCWRGREGTDVLDVTYGKNFDQGHLADAKTQGAQQAFAIDADRQGYTQEIALPWKLLSSNGAALKAPDRFNLTVEPNFTIGSNGRMSLKDLFKPNMSLDRVFTFMNSPEWGWATLEPQGHSTPAPVRLADTRLFPVHLAQNLPVVDWTSLIRDKALAGFKTISLTMPQDGYLSLILKNTQGQTVRQLLDGTFVTRGKHRFLWDGLTSPNGSQPGQPVPPGVYTWSAIYHTGIGLKLRGWADCAGTAPWDNGPATAWGGDHGLPTTVATDGKRMLLGWSAAEAGKALIATDLQGNVLWRINHGGIAGVQFVAVDSSAVFAVAAQTIYRVAAETGLYTAWSGRDSTDLDIADLWPNSGSAPPALTGMDASNGKLYLSFGAKNTILILDTNTGKLLQTLNVKSPYALKVVRAAQVYVLSGDASAQDKPAWSVLRLDPQTGDAQTLVEGLANATALTVGSDGRLYVGVGEPDNQVKVYDSAGHPVGTLGRLGGRAKLGPWTPDGMLAIASLSLDAQGKLWVMEADYYPKRVSIWDTKTGKLVKEFFGPTPYGARSGAIDPLDPNIMVGEGCEWRLNPTTGQASCLGTITRESPEETRFGVGPNGHLYLAVASGSIFSVPPSPVRFFERVGDADYRLRGMFFYTGKGPDAQTHYWADENGDGQIQPSEVTTVAGTLRFSGWYMEMAPDLTLYAGDHQLKVVGFTPAGAPKYDLTAPPNLPGSGVNPLGSPDNRLILWEGGEDGTEHTVFTCYDIASGKKLWDYPDTFVQVHGSHNAPPPETGLIRGSYGPCGVAKLPAPVGNVWFIPTNVGEWHILTQDGYYLTRLFQPDPLKVRFPDQAVPGADITESPPGSGSEDFGGSIAQDKAGKVYIQGGKVGFWNLEVTGLNSVRPLDETGRVTISHSDLLRAQAFHDQYAQAAIGTRSLTIHAKTPVFTGNLDADFQDEEVIHYQKLDEAAVRSAAAWDQNTLYLAWDVRDPTPWVNGAGAAENMYLGGDTVDFQLGTDPTADKNRDVAVLGDLRLSIGNFQGTPTAVLYRKVAREKHPRSFSSGVIKNYLMEDVRVLSGIPIKVNKRGDGYTVEAAIPFVALEFQPTAGLTLRGDFGVTHGDSEGLRTHLRTYWSNQHTGIVDDAVFELMLEPKNWGVLTFAP